MTNRTSIGEPPVDNKCPLCQTSIDDELSGYGLAYGGFGVYFWCANEDCKWFYKILDQEE